MSHLYSFSIFAQCHSTLKKNYNNNFWMNNSTFWVKNGLKNSQKCLHWIFFFDKNRPLKLVWKILYGNFIQKQNFWFRISWHTLYPIKYKLNKVDGSQKNWLPLKTLHKSELPKINFQNRPIPISFNHFREMNCTC